MNADEDRQTIIAQLDRIADTIDRIAVTLETGVGKDVPVYYSIQPPTVSVPVVAAGRTLTEIRKDQAVQLLEILIDSDDVTAYPSAIESSGSRPLNLEEWFSRARAALGGKPR
jgi:hypothetical protein